MDAETDSLGAAAPRTTLARAVAAVYLIVFGALGYAAWERPTWEWDLLGYLGCLEEFAGSDVEEAHRSVYAQIEGHAPAAAFEELRAKIPYREKLANDAEAFDAQLPFYRGRVVYLGLLRVLSALGVPPVRGAYLLSILAGLVLAWVVYRWLEKFWPPVVAAGLAFGALQLAGHFNVSTLATPDMLAASFLIAGVWCIYELRRVKTGVVLFLLAIGTRPDHLLLVLPVLQFAVLGLGVAGSNHGRLRAVSVFLCVFVFLCCTKLVDTYSWWKVFHHTFFGYKAFPATETPSLDLIEAIGYTLRSLPKFKDWRALLFLLVWAGAATYGWRRARHRDATFGLASAAMLGLLAHFALLPVLWPRLMMPYWIVIAIAACTARGRR